MSYVDPIERRRRALEYRRTHTTDGHLKLRDRVPKREAVPSQKPSLSTLGHHHARPFVDPPWMDDAACRGLGLTDLFFPDDRETFAKSGARAVCEQCPVMVECREHAIAHGERHGMWGGTSERERRAIRKQRKAAS